MLPQAMTTSFRRQKNNIGYNQSDADPFLHYVIVFDKNPSGIFNSFFVFFINWLKSSWTWNNIKIFKLIFHLSVTVKCKITWPYHIILYKSSVKNWQQNAKIASCTKRKNKVSFKRVVFCRMMTKCDRTRKIFVILLLWPLPCHMVNQGLWKFFSGNFLGVMKFRECSFILVTGGRAK